MLSSTLFIMATALSPSSHACPINHLDLEAISRQYHTSHTSSYSPSLVSEIDFNEMVQKTEAIYKPLFESHGLTLRIEADWKSETENAYSDAEGKTRLVYLNGGYARHPLMTKDAYQSVICHEIGHHLGGFPHEMGSPWASVEGEADYYSTLKCMKLVMNADPLNQSIANQLDLPDVIKAQCKAQFPAPDAYAICLRSAKASEEYGRVNASLATPNARKPVSLLTPENRRSILTNMSYPSTQCRVDTKLQGALCNVSPLIAIGYSDPTVGTCGAQNYYELGARPTCWFDPFDK